MPRVILPTSWNRRANIWAVVLLLGGCFPGLASTQQRLTQLDRSLIHSPAPAVTPIGENMLMLEDFSAYVVGKFPDYWRTKEKQGIDYYRVVADAAGSHYLRADVVKAGSSMFRRVQWDIKKYPVLEWRWRGRLLPERGNGKRRSTNDNVVAIYVVFPFRWVIPGWSLPDTLKYAWSTTLPVGTEFSNGANRNKVFVLRQGSEQLGEWVVEQRNIYRDYKRRYRKRKVPDPIAIGVITDADNTKSQAAGDYDYFKIIAAAEIGEEMVDKDADVDKSLEGESW